MRDPAKERHYQANKQAYMDRSRAVRIRCEQIIREAKEVPCADCGVEYPPWVMDFDHRDPTQKLNIVSKMRAERTVREEIAKCDVVCANCHRERTHAAHVSRKPCEDAVQAEARLF